MSFDLQVCQRLPLADAALHMLRLVAEPAFLGELYNRHRGRCYERQIGFASLVQLLADALVVHGQSAHRTFQQAQDDGELQASIKAAYDKVARTPIAVSTALLTEGTQRLRELLPASFVEDVPASLAAFTPLAFDGKKIKKVAKRLQAVRRVRGQVLGGKLLVAEDVRTGLAVAMAADPDGEAADLTLVPALLAKTRAVVAGERLWIGDRIFCNLIHLPMLAADGDHLVVRYHASVHFHLDSERLAGAGVNEQGQAYREEWGWLGGPKDARRLYVRRITVQRPGDEDVSVVTDLLDGARYPATDILAMYLRRWGIERLFQKVSEVFHLDALVSAQANGTVFQAALCFLLYNLTVVIRAHVARGVDLPTADVSLEKLFVDLTRQLTGMVEVIGVVAIVDQYDDVHWTATQLRQHLTQVLGATWRDWWRKSPPRKNSPPTPTEYLKGGHSSVYKIVRGLHQTRPEPDKPRPSKQ